MCGVPVLCSHHCGAADLIQAPWLGESFPPLSLASGRRWRDGSPEGSAPGGDPAGSTLVRPHHGDSASDYLLSVIRHVSGSGPRPAPPVPRERSGRLTPSDVRLQHHWHENSSQKERG